MKVLLSIRPEYAKKIFNGKKKYEYRRVIFKNRNIHSIVVYATKPIKKIIGEFEIDEILSDRPNKIWEKTYKYSGISKEYFDLYTNSKEIIYAIKIGNYKLYQKPKLLTCKKKIKSAPQSFIYI